MQFLTWKETFTWDNKFTFNWVSRHIAKQRSFILFHFISSVSKNYMRSFTTYSHVLDICTPSWSPKTCFHAVTFILLSCWVKLLKTAVILGGFPWIYSLFWFIMSCLQIWEKLLKNEKGPYFWWIRHLEVLIVRY